MVFKVGRRAVESRQDSGVGCIVSQLQGYLAHKKHPHQVPSRRVEANHQGTPRDERVSVLPRCYPTLKATHGQI